MYNTFFGLHESPFNSNPDPRFLYLTGRTRAAMDELTYGIQGRKGFILLTGEAGTGKTTLIQYLLNWLRARRMPTAFIFNSHLNPNHLFDFIAADFGIPADHRLNNNMLMRLNGWLIERFRAGETPVLIIDEAQGLSFELLEEIRLLLNLETASEKLLQIVLAGQPELDQKLKRPELRQLRQRITLRCNTAAMSIAEMRGYIAERLRIAGATGAPIFASEAMDAVYFYSLGIPRTINLLCEHSLVNAYAEQSRVVLARMVEEAAHEFLLDEREPVMIRRGAGEIVNDNLAVIHTIFADGLSGVPSIENAKEPAPAIMPATASVIPHHEVAAFASTEPVGLLAKRDGEAIVELVEASPASKEKLDEGCARQELATAKAAPEKKQKVDVLREYLNASDVRVAAPPLADKQSQAKVLPMLPIPVSEPGIERAPVATVSVRIADAERCAVSQAGTKQVSHKIFRTGVRAMAMGKLQNLARRKGAPARMAPDKWLRMPHTALLKILSSVLFFRELLRCWARDFKQDWLAMIKDTPLAGMKEPFFRWLRRLVRPAQWRSAKVTPLQAPRNTVP
jgi:type II secretory pathway predicted ATPase ExeA